MRDANVLCHVISRTLRVAGNHRNCTTCGLKGSDGLCRPLADLIADSDGAYVGAVDSHMHSGCTGLGPDVRLA